MKAFPHVARRLAAAMALAGAAVAAQAGGVVGTTFPAGFTVPADASTGAPVLGFGGAGPVRRTPVIILHGNDATPYSTGCEKSGTDVQGLAQYLADWGWEPGELWALGWLGNQCDTLSDPAASAGATRTMAANVPDLRAFVQAVRAYTGSFQVDIVAHGTGVTLAREWARQDGARKLVRRFVAIEGPNRGTAMCAASPQNYWSLGFLGGYGPASPLCQEIGSPFTPFLQELNDPPAPIDPNVTLVIRNRDASYPYIPVPDGGYQPAPQVDVYGNAVDFSGSARIRKAAYELSLTGQGVYDLRNATAHAGIFNSPTTRSAVRQFLRR